MIACRVLRPELRHGEFLHEKLKSTKVSHATNRTVHSTICVLRTLQLLCTVPNIVFFAAVVHEFWDEWARTGHLYFVLLILVWLQGFVAGGARLVSLLLAILSVTEVLRDSAATIANRTNVLLVSGLLRVADDASTEAEEVPTCQHETAQSVLSDARNLGADLAKARKILHPALVGTLSWSAACSALQVVAATAHPRSCDVDVCHWPDSVFFALSAFFGE